MGKTQPQKRNTEAVLMLLPAAQMVVVGGAVETNLSGGQHIPEEMVGEYDQKQEQLGR